ncbi:MAG: putative Ig domain-containing protein [Spirochaetota bacterium]
MMQSYFHYLSGKVLIFFLLLVASLNNCQFSRADDFWSFLALFNARRIIPTSISLFYENSPYTLTKNVTTSMMPTVTGEVISCFVSPDLPAGLSLDTTTCEISGIPDATQSMAEYTITAQGTKVSSSTTVNISINEEAPSSLTYSDSPYVFTPNIAIASVTPTVTGSIANCTVSPDLPAGLALDNTNCAISGTPDSVYATDNFIITASNSYGSTTATISITVSNAAPSALSYTGSPFVFTKDVTIAPSHPTVTGTVTSYSVAPALPTGLTIDPSTGQITGIPTILLAATNYTITATNSEGSTTSTISITVNDTAPASLSYAGSPFIFTKNATITGVNPTVTGTVTSYSVSPALPTGLAINTTTGQLAGTPTVISATTNYTVTATNSAGSTTATISITVDDITPTSLSYAGSPFVFTKDATITVVNPTVTGTPTSYSVSPTLPTGLTINTTTGQLAGTPTVLSTTPTNYTVTATNTGGSTTATISIVVNDNAPTSLSYAGSPFVFTKDATITAVNPTVTGTPTSYSVSPALPTGLTIHTTTGQLAGTPTVLSTTPTNYTVTATNTGGSTTATISIVVNDDAPTSLSYTGSPYVFTKDATIIAVNPTVTGTPTSYSVSPTLPTGLAINTTTGQLAGTPTAISTTTSYTVTATNSGGNTTATISITVNDAAPSSLSYAGSPFVFTKDVTITAVNPTVTGTPTSYSVSPTLPTGLAINTTTGQLAGTPTVISTTASYTVTATNSGGSTNASITITVNDAVPTISITGSPFTFSINSAITAINPTLGGGATTSCSSSPSLPTGLNIASSTCVISGTPTVASGATNYTITAGNSSGSDTAVIQISVIAASTAPTIVYSSSPFSLTTGQSANITPTLGGDPPTSCSSSPSLPTGLSINSTTCIISGTPSANSGVTSYTITASNSGGNNNAVVQISSFSSSISQSYPISNTGQTTCYNTSSAISCGSNPDGDANFPRQDANYPNSPASRSFTGPTAHVTYTADYTTKDNVTGLIWKTCSEGLSGSTCVTGAANTYTWADAQTACTNLNSANSGNGYAGRTDWRFPSIEELETLSNQGAANPSIETSYFPGTISFRYWSSTELASSSSDAWLLRFDTGSVDDRAKTDDNYVRCVASGLTSTRSFTDNSDYTITDNVTGLVWQKCSRGQTEDASCSGSALVADWQTALQYCKNLTLAGKSWRLPSLKELLTIRDRSVFTPAIDSTYFPNTKDSSYWSSTTKSDETSKGWRVNFDLGNYDFVDKTGSSRLRCVADNTTPTGIAPTISITGSPFSFSKDSSTTSITPSLGGGTPTSCSASPSLPTGFTINSTTCVISGTPTTYQAATNYTITASNASGGDSKTISIAVEYFTSDWDTIQPILAAQQALGLSGAEAGDRSTIAGLSGSYKWYGGVLASNGKIYGIPYDSNKVLIIDPTTNTANTNTITGLSGNQKWNSGVLGPNGKIYGIPSYTNKVLIIDPTNNTTDTSSITGLSGNYKWAGGVLAPNGKIYGIPADSTKVLIIDTANNTANTSSIAGLSGTFKWCGGVLAPNGKIYGIPDSSDKVLIIDPTTDTADTSSISGLSGSEKWCGGVLASNGKIYGIPHSSNKVLIIDPTTNTTDTTTITGLSGTWKWSGGVLAPNGKIYGIPYDSNKVLIIDPANNTASTSTITGLSGTQKWFGGVLAPNGKIYGIPADSNNVLIIDPKSNGSWPADLYLSPYFDKY